MQPTRTVQPMQVRASSRARARSLARARPASARTRGSSSCSKEVVESTPYISYKSHDYSTHFIPSCRLRPTKFFVRSLSKSIYIIRANGTVGCTHTNSYTVLQLKTCWPPAPVESTLRAEDSERHTRNAWTVMTPANVRIALHCDTDAVLHFALMLTDPGFVASQRF